MSDKKKPIKKFRRGRVEAAIWENQTDTATFYSVTLERSYKDGDTYKTSSSLNPNDLANASRVLECADLFIYNQQIGEAE